MAATLLGRRTYWGTPDQSPGSRRPRHRKTWTLKRSGSRSAKSLLLPPKPMHFRPSPVPLFVLPRLLTTEEFGFMANRSADWLRDQICTGRIRAHGRPWAIPYRELEKYRVDLATAAQRLSQRSVEPSAA